MVTLYLHHQSLIHSKTARLTISSSHFKNRLLWDAPFFEPLYIQELYLNKYTNEDKTLASYQQK